MYPDSLARPLYLQNSSAQRLDMSASARLRIERKAQSEIYIPLHHVSRIVCSSTLEIGSRVWVACMQNGIPIAVLDTKGRTLGWCMGSRRKESSLRQMLMHALDDPCWDELYKQWYAQQETAIAVQNLIMCGVPATAAARNQSRAALCNAHYLKHGFSCAPWLDQIAELAKLELASALHREVGAPELLAWYRAGLNLYEELGSLVGMHAHTDIHHATMHRVTENAGNWSIRQYERCMPLWQDRIAHILVSFEQFLRAHWQ